MHVSFFNAAHLQKAEVFSLVFNIERWPMFFTSTLAKYLTKVKNGYSLPGVGSGKDF